MLGLDKRNENEFNKIQTRQLIAVVHTFCLPNSTVQYHHNAHRVQGQHSADTELKMHQVNQGEDEQTECTRQQVHVHSGLV